MSGYYDNRDFFFEYSQMPRSKGLQYAGEWHQFREMMPDFTGKTVLDLGCGMGWHSKYISDGGAASVLGIDISEKMLEQAQSKNNSDRITYRLCSLEEYDYPHETFDVILSNLVLHYLDDLTPIYNKIYGALRPGGTFLFNIEHPSFTSGVNQQWITDENGKPVCWPIDNYYYLGARKTDFLRYEITKYHHTLEQIINPLLKLGLTLTDIREAMPPEDMMNIPGMEDEMRRPMMLLARFDKIQP